MTRNFFGLFGGKSELKAFQICASAEAVCAVALGAQVRRLHVHRSRAAGGCEIEGFDELPLFSKLIICLVARATRKKVGSEPPDRADLDRAAALAASAAPSQHEELQLLRLAREEAEQLIDRRWTNIRRMAAALAKDGNLAGERVTKIALQSDKAGARKGRLQRGGSRSPGPTASSAPLSWFNGIFARWAAALGKSNGRTSAARRAGGSRQGARPQRGLRAASGRQAGSTVRP
jgi:hypothetical protein